MDAVVPASRGVPLGYAFDWRRAAMLGVVVVGIALRVVQYVGSGSLWMDELALARNVVDREWGELVGKPLSFGQAAPVGFVLTQKALVTALASDDDFVLRLVPWSAALASLILFWRLAERVLGGIGSLVAVTLFATAVPLLFFATQAKQYSTDVLASTLIILCGAMLDSPRVTRQQLVICALIGATLAWLSHPALLVLGAAGIVVLVRVAWRSLDARSWWPVACVVAVWGASALASLILAMSSVPPDLRRDMVNFWSSGLPPASMNPWIAVRWLLVQLETIVGAFGTASLRYPAPIVYAALGLLGALALLWRRQLLGQMAIGIGVVAVAAVFARQYPLADRLALYLIPIGLLLIAAGVDAMHSSLARHGRRVAALTPVLVVPLLWPVVHAPPPYQLENVHPMLRDLQEHRQPADRIYVYYGAMLAFDFYAARYGFTDDAYTAGACHRPDNREYLAEVDVMRGAPRVWVFFSHAVSRYRDREDLLGYLDTIGRRLQRIAPVHESGPPDVELYLYDLSDPTRLAQSDPTRYDAMGPETPVPPCAPTVTRRKRNR